MSKVLHKEDIPRYFTEPEGLLFWNIKVTPRLVHMFMGQRVTLEGGTKVWFDEAILEDDGTLSIMVRQSYDG